MEELSVEVKIRYALKDNRNLILLDNYKSY